MSHTNPRLELEVVVERAADLLVAELERKRFGRTKGGHGRAGRGDAEKGAPTEQVVETASSDSLCNEEAEKWPQTGSSKGVTRAARREVYERDGARCTYVSENGQRCDARRFLELDHVVPKALGGSNEVENLRVRCRAHNRLWAEQVFGRDRVARRINEEAPSRPSDTPFFQQKSAALAGSRAQSSSADVVFEKVRLALFRMGFGREQVRRALFAVMKRRGNETLAIEGVMREALLVATAA